MHGKNRATGARRGPKNKYPFEEMAVWEVFCVPDDMGVITGRGTSMRRHSVDMSARQWGKRYQPDWRWRVEVGDGLVRCTRIA